MSKIAFGCQSRVGKDTAADHLISKYGGHKLSFAKPIYNILNYAISTTGLKKGKDREFLQMVGMWGRDRDPDVWVNCLLRQVDKIPENENIFISDVRFPNEFDALQKAGFTCIRIIRDAEKNTHISEISLLDHKWDINIQNNGTLAEFY